MSKVCNVCSIEKEFNDYYKNKLSPDGFHSRCKMCVKKANSEYRENNVEKLKEYHKEYQKNNKEVIQKISKDYKSKNSEKVKEYSEKYRAENLDLRNTYLKNNKDKISNQQKKYYEKNKKILNQKKITKRNEDPLYRFSTNIRNRIKQSIKNGGYDKNVKTLEILGESFLVVLNHLNNNLYGFVYGDEGLDVDHIIPLATAKTEDEVIKLNHYSNLQLLPSDYNRHIKITKTFNRIHFEDWFYNKTQNN